jgi:hypothetical protein
MKEKIFGFWLGCPCSEGGKLFQIEEFPFVYANGYEEMSESELREWIKWSKKWDHRPFALLPDVCSICRGANDYVVFMKKDISEVLKHFPWVKTIPENESFYEPEG